MPRKKKEEQISPPPKTFICKFCGKEIEDGHRCNCKEARNEFAKQLFEEYYGRKRRKHND